MTLIIAVFALALIMALLLAMLQGVNFQTQGGQRDNVGVREEMMADSAVALVIGQIQQATAETGQTWISQPGLIRTYDVSGSRQPTACYKLYSSTQMVDTTGTLAFLATDAPPDWNAPKNLGVYTDLNAPVKTGAFFSTAIYPILDAAAATSVEGVSVDSGYGVNMPVQWLYQLQDGTLGPASGATKTNPIVGRIAFWTDDDTCKVNINTAGCGTGWNVPHANSTDDVTWGSMQPAKNEFSSYPGHPATTSLAPVFASLTPQELLGLTPRYPWGGSQFCTVTTSAGASILPKPDRLYTSLDELCFSSSQDSSGQRQTNAVTASEIETARFVLTAHSRAPETTMLGEPRFAIWPVSDSTQDATRTTATDRAFLAAATVGSRSYIFERHNALSATDDLSSTVVPSNAQLFSDLVARGATILPGWGKNFSQKYTGATWTQLMLEIVDFIRGLNAVDPSAAPFVSYAAGDLTGVGRGFIVPLTTTYGSGAGAVTLRGINRCPTLSSLTLVFYVCGYGFKSDPTHLHDIDFEGMTDSDASAAWSANFDRDKTNKWSDVTSEIVRAFVIPCTYEPGCAYPEVSDACDVEIDGLNNIKISGKNVSGDLGLPATAHSSLLSDALKVLPADRTWGGNEGPLAWRAAANYATAPYANYPFAGTGKVWISKTDTTISATSPDAWKEAIKVSSAQELMVKIRDRSGNTLQTFSVSMPTFSIHAPTANGECDHKDGSTPDSSVSDWAKNSGNHVDPCYYMNLYNRLMATQLSRNCFIQAGDVVRSVEANTDMRVIAALASVPSSLFHPHPSYTLNSVNIQGGSQAHNIRFADGTSAAFASGTTQLISVSYPTLSGSMTAMDWNDGSAVSYTWATSPACGAPTGTKYVMIPVPTGTTVTFIYGDWDTGPGIEPDGAQVALPDAGTTLTSTTAYFSLAGGQVGAATQRLPNALVPSPVVFGSLPAGINPSSPASSEPWRTLLFCPYPAGDSTHPGFTSPPDYLILDNFWMPVVEPYPVSGCMETAGKINLNDQIAPFTWLHRNTALHALLADLRIPAIPASMANKYKSSGSAIASIWKTVDENATISQIEDRFSNGSADAYLSESEICSVPLVPVLQPKLDTSSVSAVKTALDAFWNGSSGAGRLTGDNLRELPYAQLYSRLTTRSNSFTVHVRAQVLQKLATDTRPDVWTEGSDLVLGEWRGSYEIERYLDPTATAPTAGQPLGPYKFRIVSKHPFAPQ